MSDNNSTAFLPALVIILRFNSGSYAENQCISSTFQELVFLFNAVKTLARYFSMLSVSCNFSCALCSAITLTNKQT